MHLLGYRDAVQAPPPSLDYITRLSVGLELIGGAGEETFYSISNLESLLTNRNKSAEFAREKPLQLEICQVHLALIEQLPSPPVECSITATTNHSRFHQLTQTSKTINHSLWSFRIAAKQLLRFPFIKPLSFIKPLPCDVPASFEV